MEPLECSRRPRCVSCTMLCCILHVRVRRIEWGTRQRSNSRGILGPMISPDKFAGRGLGDGEMRITRRENDGDHWAMQICLPAGNPRSVKQTSGSS